MELILPILISGTAIAIATGYLGSFALLRRMALVGDALSHVALPGIALGLMFHFNVLIGSLAFLILSVIIIWVVEHKTKLNVDTLVGVLFTLALAIGAVLSSGEELLDSLFGDIGKITNVDFWVILISSIVIVLALLILTRKLLLNMISKDIAFSLGMKPHIIELLFLLIFALTVAIGIKFIGALLMGALIIIPAATARNLAHNFKNYAVISVLMGVISVNFGIIIASFYNLDTGPVIVILASTFFFLSIFFQKR